MAFFNADCGDGGHDPLKETVVCYLCDRKSWRHNKIDGMQSNGEICDEDYFNKWLPLAEKIVRRKAELEGAVINLDWFRTRCPEAYYEPTLMKAFFPGGVPH